MTYVYNIAGILAHYDLSTASALTDAYSNGNDLCIRINRVVMAIHAALVAVSSRQQPNAMLTALAKPA